MDKRDIKHLVDLTTMGRPSGAHDPTDVLAGNKLSETGRTYAIGLFANQLEQLSQMGMESPETQRIVKALAKMRVTNGELIDSFSDVAFMRRVKEELSPFRAEIKAKDMEAEAKRKLEAGLDTKAPTTKQAETLKEPPKPQKPPQKLTPRT